MRGISMTMRIHKGIIIFIAFLLITASNAAALTNTGYDNILAYAGYGLLFLRIFLTILGKKIEKKEFLLFIVVFILFSYGLYVQNLPSSTKIRLILTMLVLAVLSVLSGHIINSFRDFRMISYGILAGVIISMGLAVWNDAGMIKFAVEGVIFSYGFTGGLEHKNYFAAAMVASFIGIFLYHKNERKKITDRLVLFIEGILIILSNSRGGWVIFAVFLVVIHYDLIMRIRSTQRSLFKLVVIFLICIIAGLFYSEIVSNSGSYLNRAIGLQNYFKYYNRDWRHLILGDAAMAFRGTGAYNYNVRSTLGWNGTTELTLLSILLKNGFLGLAGYSIIFVCYFRSALKSSQLNYKLAIYSVLATMLASSLVETYMVNINLVFGPCLYCLLSGLTYMCGKTQNGGNAID